MKTQQTGSRQAPGPSDDNVLALIIKCPLCSTQRAFKVNDAFIKVATRLSSGIEYNTWCEKCGRRFAVQLCWTRRHPKWVSEKIVFENAVTVEDTFGMGPEEGGKSI